MGASTKEKGVLKLVHPGRHVEYHKKSIMASEIMRKNPRHCITRLDFFENPHIVVRPESILVPGQVFYIVPNKTIHRLVKDRHQNKCYYEETSPLKTWAGRTPKHEFPQAQERSNRESLEDYELDDSLIFQAKDYYLNRDGRGPGVTMNDDQERRRGDKKVMNLESCMKKKGSTRESLNLRVTFDSRTMIQSQTEVGL